MASDSTVFTLGITYDRIINALRTESDLNIPNNLKWPCSICNKNVTESMKSIRCDTCKRWCHIKCDGSSAKEYEKLVMTDSNEEWHCLYCTMKFNHENFAFALIGDTEIDKINQSDSMKFCEFLPSLECIAETDKFMNVQLQSENDYCRCTKDTRCKIASDIARNKDKKYCVNYTSKNILFMKKQTNRRLN